MTTRSSRAQIERLIQYGADFTGAPVLDWPDLDEIQAAIDAGAEGAVEVRLLGTEQFSSTTAYANHAIVRRKVSFETIKLTHVRDLEINSDDGVNLDGFSFVGEVREYQNDWHEHGGETIRSYSSQMYMITFRTGLRVPCVYSRMGFGQGTEFEGGDD